MICFSVKRLSIRNLTCINSQLFLQAPP